MGAPITNKFKKIKHSLPMLSLSNTFNAKGMKDFMNKISNYLNIKNKKFNFSSELKIDGISASLSYKNGILIKGLSRGDGVTGEDILENLKTINQIPKKIIDNKLPKIIEVRGEVYIEQKRFYKITKKFCKSKKCSWWLFKTKRF